MVKNNSIFNKKYTKLSTNLSLIFTTLLAHTTTPTISNKNLFLYFSQFSPSYPTLTCLQNHPWKLHWHYLSPYSGNSSEPFIQFRQRHRARELESLVTTDTGYDSNNGSSQSLIPYCSSSESWCIAGSSLWWRCLPSEWETIQSIFSQNLDLLSLFPHLTNTITRTHILQKSSYLTLFSS